MKKLLLLLSLPVFTGVISSQNVRTSIADGLGTNPFVWDCTCLPFPNDSIIINHNITLNVDFGFTDGAVVINAPGSLIGDTPNRNFAFSNSANFINHGNFDVARVAFAGGSAMSDGTFAADSFYTNINSTAGWVSTGDMDITYSYWNTGKFVLGNGAELIVGDNFYNGDSLISGVNAVLVSDGAIRVNGDFANSDTLKGSGQVCIYGSSVNIGVITGTLDMCDNTGGGQVDFNFGTISGTVTTCVAPCNIGINDFETISLEVYPNPSTDLIQFESDWEMEVVIFDMMGKLVHQSTIPYQLHSISTIEWSAGIYTYKVYSDHGTASGKIVKQ